MIFSHSLLIYRVTTGPAISDETYSIKKKADGFIIQSGNTVWECDRNLSQTLWRNREQDTGNNYSAQREKNRLSLEGTFEGRQVRKEYVIDDHPWTQCAHFSLAVFAGSDRSETFYWFISPHNLQVYKIKAVKMQTESIMIHTTPENVRKIRIRPAGFEGNFWHGDYWYRLKDNQYVRYQAVHGPPGTPPTVKELVAEKEP